MPLSHKINMCMSVGIEKYCAKKKEEQAKYKKLVTAGNNPLITSRSVYSRSQVNRNYMRSVSYETVKYMSLI